MVRKTFLGLLLVVAVVAFSGCAMGSGGVLHRGWNHLQWHILGAYKDLTNLHEEIDKYVFNLDIRDPDRY
jgi:hypothetical protein